MLKIGIIGAGTITKRHITNYQENPNCEVVAIADINPAQAKKTATEYGIKDIYTDYHDILNDPSIDAVSIATPTFTHKDIALDAIRSHKHIICEKPPAFNADEVKEIQAALEGYDKVFMFAFVRRFNSQTQYVKDYIDSGKMGKIICGAAVRLALMTPSVGWFSQKKLGGGTLKDATIHELDTVLYLMGYPKPKTVSAFQTTAYLDICTKVKSNASAYPSADKNSYIKDTEDMIQAIVTLDNGASIYVKAGNALLTHDTGCYLEISGERAGIKVSPFNSEKPIDVIEIRDDYYITNSTPRVTDNNAFKVQMDHFVDCCINGTACATKLDEAVTVMEIIDAIYKSAETGLPVVFK